MVSYEVRIARSAEKELSALPKSVVPVLWGKIKALASEPKPKRSIVNRKTFYNPPSLGGRELEGGGIHPHLNPLPSRERNFARTYAEYYSYSYDC